MPNSAADKMITKLIDQAVASLPKRRQNAVAAKAHSVLGDVPLEDLQAHDVAVLGQALDVAEAALAKPGARTLSVDTIEHDLTLVCLTMGNRPFVVDSVLQCLTKHDSEIRLVAHPLIDDSKRSMVSLMLVVMEAMDDKERRQVKKNLRHVLNQVRLVTDDWRRMLSSIGERTIALRTSPPPVPADELAEAVQFLDWLCDHNFTLMGLREYKYEGTREAGELKPVAGSALGILRNDDLAVMQRDGEPVVNTPEIRDFLFGPNPLFITKADLRSKVHRDANLDYIGIKRYTPDGRLEGEMRVVGLFTSTAYTKSVKKIPMLRHKVDAVMRPFKLDEADHTSKALVNVLETWPRDEVFQINTDQLREFANTVIKLEERPRVLALARTDKFDRFVSVLVYIPRDRYDSDVRQRVGAYLERAFHGTLLDFSPQFFESGLTRVHFIIGRSGQAVESVSSDELNGAVRALVQNWQDKLLVAGGKSAAQHTYSIGYRENVEPEQAIADAAQFEMLRDETDLEVDYYDAHDFSEGQIGLRIFHLNSAVPLSQRVPLLENLGFEVIEESTYDITRADGAQVFAHDMKLRTASGVAPNLERIEPILRAAIIAVWHQQTDDDQFNALVLTCKVDWRVATVFRAYARYLRQIRSRFSVESMAETLVRYPQIATDLAVYFDLRFNPALKDTQADEEKLSQEIVAALDEIKSSDDDRILRNFHNLIGATLRTNFFAQMPDLEDKSVAPDPVLAFKIDPGAVNIMPQPVPYREIFVSSPRVEGLHLRFGPVARGGLRWSDRAQDYRTEVLGLVKAQQVKNAVIVPVGSKGGFVPKQLPSRNNREAWFNEGRTAYQIFISSLLSLTDNLIDGKVVHPKDVVCHDGEDPYFVVAADKGTSTFSDTANAISQARDFWLDDAFASGGSAGYDHKKMGITARGAWEAVKRHFREMQRDNRSWDIQSQPFTAAGVGDMSGDVFGNGMLLSKQTRLIAAFDHRDIFIDPDPDPARSYAERKRLFKADRSSWQDYDRKCLSKGGGIWPRDSKRITLPSAAARSIGLSAGTFTPQEVMTAILTAEVDLMWFGGIGTYIRATHESDGDVGDRANDSIRVTARQLRCKVIGEGANLGVTQPGRIEFNQRGGRCNSDAIDNSAGVNSSDVEVNIKIALAAGMKTGGLTRRRRNLLLESMTDTVADLVLRNNYLQTLAISLTERKGMEDLSYQQRLMQQLEARGRLDRHVEDLPDDMVLAERQASGNALTRAELGVLLAYAKIVALDDLVDSDVPDDPYFEDLLTDYFPPKMQKPFGKEIAGHRLRREIIATGLANSMINRGGPTLLARVNDRTGASVATMARAYAAARAAFNLRELHDEIDKLDAKISGDLQLELYATVQERVVSQTVWFVRYGDFSEGVAPIAERYGKAVKTLSAKLEDIVPDFLRTRIEADTKRYRAAGVPAGLAKTMGGLPIAGLIPDIALASEKSGKPLLKVAQVFFDLTRLLRVGRLVHIGRGLETTDYYDGLAVDRALQSAHQSRRNLVVESLVHKGGFEAWKSQRMDDLTLARTQLGQIIDSDTPSVSRLTVAATVLADIPRE